MRFPLVPATLVLATASLLLAQTPPPDAPSSVPWFDVIQRPEDHVKVRGRVVPVAGVTCLQFRNDRPEAVHFQFGVVGGGALEDPIKAPRVHLSAHSRSAFIPLPSGLTAPTLTVLYIRAGEDQGPLLPN